MAGQYDNNNTGVLFKNNKRETDKHPEYTGSATINNEEFWVSAWVKTSKTGEKFFSFAYKPKSPRSEYVNQVATTMSADELEDVPF